MSDEENINRSAEIENTRNRKEQRSDLTSIVIAISGDHMGKGNNELGAILMKSFIHSLVEIRKTPDTMLFFNTGVWLIVKKSDVIEDLKKLESMGVELLICGTCVDHYKIADEIDIGIISNMHEILNRMAGAGRIIIP